MILTLEFFFFFIFFCLFGFGIKIPRSALLNEVANVPLGENGSYLIHVSKMQFCTYCILVLSLQPHCSRNHGDTRITNHFTNHFGAITAAGSFVAMLFQAGLSCLF